MGEYHLNKFIKTRVTDELKKSKEYLKTAMSLRPRNMLVVISYANTCVMENQVNTAAIFYARALLLCSYTKMLLKVRKQPAPNEMDMESIELEHVNQHLKHVEALLFCAMAACKFYDNELRAARTLVDKSLSIMKTPMALRLKGSIAINRIMDEPPEAEVDGTTSPQPSPRESVVALIRQWNDAFTNAYKLDSKSLISRLYLSDMLFRKGHIDECEAMLQEINFLVLPPDLLAEATYQQARCAHIKSNWTGALKLYNNVLQLRGDYLPARIQLIKSAIGAGNLSVAREHCEYINKQNNRTPDILRLVGLVYVASAAEILDTCRAKLCNAETKMMDIDCISAINSVQQDLSRLLDERLFKALNLLEESLAIDPQNQRTLSYLIFCLELLVTRGRENMLTKLREAYVTYFSLVKEDPCLEMKNNDAVIALEFRQFEEATDKLTALWNSIESIDNVPVITKMTVQYNLGRALEESGQIQKAHKIYSALTKEYPRYTDAWLRRSKLVFNRGNVKSAHKYLDELKLHHKKSLQPWIYKAYQLFSIGRYDETIEELRNMFRAVNTASFDAYANTLFACALIKRSAKGTFGPLPKDVIQYARAGLRRPCLSNFYAANCIAIFLAHAGKLKMAYECFGILLENTAINSHMRFIANRNMGLLCAATSIGNERRIERGSFDKMKGAKAQQHLQIAMANNKMDISTYIVYSRFLYDCQRYDECVQFIESARMLFPRDIKFIYNMVVSIDAMLCKHFRNSEKLASATEVAKMLVQAQFVNRMVAHLLKIHESYPKMSKSHLTQIATRIREKLIPHMEGALPQLEEAATERQVTKGKHLELQMSIQQAHETKRLQKELEQRRAEEAYTELSEQLLKEASEIASELMYNRMPATGQLDNR
uniref:Tetratricopeptide repeat (TPR) domain containing protein n=2 Tax=Babesia bovis TaxID=5865 RepID=A7AV17_BABBO|eukprot:XP_001609211.1 tetratricopeptide repeat (TPR) domain containing protein [Babesia bovis T2Bo]